MTSSRTEASDDEWEEVVLVAEVNGVLDANLVRQAVSQGNVTLRNPAESDPILQISNSLYTGKWARTVGTDIILQAENSQMQILSTTDRYLKAEKALLTAKDGNQVNGTSTTTTTTPKTGKQSMKTVKAEKK